jgi:hypothetical protein
MKPVFCFIDDSEFELDNFREHAAWAFGRVEWIFAHSFNQAMAEMGGRRPFCFLLDLYGASPHAVPQPPDSDQLLQRIPEKLDITSLYSELPRDSSEAGNLVLRKLHGQAEKWQRLFQYAAQELGQSREYGLSNLEMAHSNYPWAACVAYSRKARFTDAMACSQAGMDGILQKPQGDGAKAIARATRQEAPDLARAAYEAVWLRLHTMAGRLALSLIKDEAGFTLARIVARTLDQKDPNPLTKALHQGQVGVLSPDQLELSSALAAWLKFVKEE